MIEFKCLIHTKSNHLITYEEFKNMLNKSKEDDKDYTITVYIEGVLPYNKEICKIKEWSYKVKDILYCDDFEIIYNDFLNGNQIERIMSSLNPNLCDDIPNILYSKLKELKNLSYRYNID